MTTFVRKKFDWDEDRKNYKWYEIGRGFSGRTVYIGKLTWKGWFRKIFGVKKPVEKVEKKEKKIKYSIHWRRSVCKRCLIEEHWFRGGGSWSPDLCPKCKQDDLVTFGNLSEKDKLKADKLYKDMWYKKHKVRL